MSTSKVTEDNPLAQTIPFRMVDAGGVRRTTLQASPRARWQHYRCNRTDYHIAAILAMVTMVSRAWNLESYRSWFVDEGIYTFQAWAVLKLGELAPYTYWYDHPFGGWLQLSGWFALTGALQRYDGQTVLAGREFMVVMAMATAVLLYVLGRRLGLRRGFAVLASALWILSPLALSFTRMVLLDNIAVPWMLAAMALVLSSQRRLLSIIASGGCFAIAILSKEVFLLLGPALLYMAWHHFRGSPNRVHMLAVLVPVIAVGGFTYILYAIVKNELIPGPDHVSLVEGQILFQLLDREGSGSAIDPSSGTYGMVTTSWLPLDRWLPLAGVAVIVPTFFIRRLRGLSMGLAVYTLMLLRNGYAPFPHIVAMLPLSALLVAGALDAVYRLGVPLRRKTWHRYFARGVSALALLAVAGSFVLFGASDWINETAKQVVAEKTGYQRQAIDWVGQHIPEDEVMITESELWLDIVNQGRPQEYVVWNYKVDTDPEVFQGMRGKPFSWLVIKPTTLEGGDNEEYPTLLRLAQSAQLVTTFGSGQDSVAIYRVQTPI